MEQAEILDHLQHVIEIPTINQPSVDTSNSQQTENPSSTSVSNPVLQRSFPTTNRTNDCRRSPPSHVFRLAFGLSLTIIQIIAAIVALSVSKHDHRHALLFAWVITYAFGRVASLPIPFWRFNLDTETSLQDPRLYFGIVLDFFFVVWFFVGHIWVLNESSSSSSSDSPILHGLCLMFFYYTCLYNVAPFFLNVAILCCLPCMTPVQPLILNRSPKTEGATTESINSLPTYKFKIKKQKHGSNSGPHESTTEVGVVAQGTKNERLLSGEDAVCCICLGKYANNDELRELMCSHLFHKDCVDKWLMINGLCPLCKSKVGKRAAGTQL